MQNNTDAMPSCRLKGSRNNKYNFDQTNSGSGFLGQERAEYVMPEAPSSGKKKKYPNTIEKKLENKGTGSSILVMLK
jgi:hypothetical protein